jgi:hypothetical protein
VWRRKGREGRTEENYWTEKGRNKLREGKEPNKFMRRGEEERKLRQCERQEEENRERELVGKKNRTDSSKERM